MSNDTELFELCKKVYELTGWGTNDNCFRDGSILWWFDNSYDGHNDHRIQSLYEAGKVGTISHPAYTSDYLLEKLPQNFEDKTDALGNFECVTNLFVEAVDNGRWQAYYRGTVYLEESETPLKALLKLVVALKEAGVGL